MSGDRESRMLAAGEAFKVKEPAEDNGEREEKTYKLRPVRIRELTELEKESLQAYKMEYLQTFKAGLKLLDSPEGNDDRLLQEVQRVGNWNLSNLPQKEAFGVGPVPITAEIKSWVEKQYGITPSTDLGIKAVMLNALDTGAVAPEDIKKMTGKFPLRGQVRYDQWWITGTLEGMLSFVHLSIRQCHPEVTKDWIKDKWSYIRLIEAARIVEDITSASVGNG
jgi:hypothetical protein